MAYLDQYMDPGIEPDSTFDTALIRSIHITRLGKEAALAWNAHDHPRRLGQDASARDLARDKVLSKRYAYGAEDMMRAWGAKEGEIRRIVSDWRKNPEIKSQAAQVDWHTHILTILSYLRYEMRKIAVNAVYHYQTKEGNKLVLRLENELNLQGQRYKKVFGNPINPQEIPEYKP